MKVINNKIFHILDIKKKNNFPTRIKSYLGKQSEQQLNIITYNKSKSVTIS